MLNCYERRLSAQLNIVERNEGMQIEEKKFQIFHFNAT